MYETADSRKLADKIKKKGGADLRPVPENLVDLAWDSEKPERPSEKAFVLDVKYAGKKFEEKLDDLRKELEKKKASGIVISMLDEIAWLFNLRGNDIPYNPVFFSYAIVTPEDATLFIDDDKLTDDVRAHFGKAVKIKPYNAIFDQLATIKSSLDSYSSEEGTPKKKFLASTKASWALSVGLGGEENVDEARSPVGDAKAVKNEVELEGMRQCHIRDGAALIEYFAWLEDQLVNKEAKLDEVDTSDKLEQIRSKHDLFVGLSFDTISSTGANAAVIHYKPLRGSCSVVDKDAIYLCDSGAQFLDGTTDTTRTLHFGTPTPEEIEAYTLVLKGNIALEQIVFPKGVSGFALDSLARQFLWAQGLDYRHGTGHGVGSFLNVHEGPIGIGTRVQYSEVSLAVGNVISNEPGYYEDGKFGIRTENIIMVKEVETKFRFGEKPYLGFEHVTQVPMCRKLIAVNLLTEGEKKYLNDYHQEVYEKTKGFFDGDEVTLNWLKKETASL
jgi:Xaa-Pro aminopeptidase